MGKTFRRNEGRYPKWDKKNNKKSRKFRELEEEKHYGHNPRPVLNLREVPDESEL